MADLPDFHPSTVIRQMAEQGWEFTISDALTGVAIFGATGSGKTSGSGKHLAMGYLAADFGGLVLCAKREECEQWKAWAAATGRTEDLIIFDASGKYCFNFLEWEASQSLDVSAITTTSGYSNKDGGFTMNIVALVEEIITGLAPPDRGGGGENVFFEDALHQQVFFLVELPQLAGYELDFTMMRDILRSAPISREQAKDPEWQKESACWHFLCAGQKATEEADDDVKADYAECRAYWLDDYANLSEKTRSIITLMFTKLAQPFGSRPLRKLFSGKGNVKPEDAFKGKLFIIDLSTQQYRLAGRIAALVWKYCFQVAVMRRKPAPQGQYLRPVFIWADEAAENFLSRGDSAFQAVARSAAGCTVYLGQNINQYRKQLGSDDAFESFIANLQTKFFHQGTGPTATWSSALLGEEWVKVASTNSNTGRSAKDEATTGSGTTVSEQRRYKVEPSSFTTLKRGGPAFGFQVEAYVYKGGHLFPGGQSFKLLTFNQR